MFDFGTLKVDLGQIAAVPSHIAFQNLVIF